MEQIKKINPHLFTFSLWGGLFLWGICGAISLEAGEPSWRIFLLFAWIGIGAIIFSSIYFLVSLYRCWTVIQGEIARTTPGKAVGFLFIPLFNVYWVFVAIRGLAKDANAFCSRKENREISLISVGLSTALCIIPIIPFVNYIALILQTVLIYQWAKFLNYAMALEVSGKIKVENRLNWGFFD